MKKVTLFLIAMFCIGLTGCSKDAEINAFITEFESVTKELTSKIDSDPSAEGIAAAQKAFDGKKAGLKAKWDAIKDAVGMQVSADVKKKLEDSVTSNMKTLTDVATKNAMKMAQSDGAVEKFQALMKDYSSIFEMPKK
ncbi:MAG: hypothetical protein IPK01_07575 [Acidobacteria bacterium]|nr:hypothetical protein [Acidobacteriota bacterium]